MFDALVVLDNEKALKGVYGWLSELGYSPYIEFNISKIFLRFLSLPLEVAVFSEEIISKVESQFFQVLEEGTTHPCIIIMTRFPTVECAVKYLKAGAYDYLVLPVGKSKFFESVREGVENKKLFFEILSLSEKIKKVNKTLELDKKRITREKRDLSRLFRVIKVISSTLDINKIVSKLYKEMQRIFSCSFVSFVLQQDTSVDVILKIPRKYRNMRRDNISHLSRSIFQVFKDELFALEGDSILSVPIENQSVYFLKVSIDWSGGFHLLPLCVADKLVGLIIVYVSEEFFEPLSKRLKKLLTAIIKHASVVLSNAQEHKRKVVMAITDPLTGLYNKGSFYEYLSREINRAYRYGKDIALMILDIDYFKRVNDTYGHQTGDELLKKVAGVLISEVRQTDVVARFGGEEFVVILPETDAVAARLIAERIRHRFEKLAFSSNGVDINVTVSIGVAACKAGFLLEKDTFLRVADEALYKAKKGGRNKVVLTFWDN